MNESPINQNDIRDLEELASRNLKARHLSSLLLEAPSPLQRMVIYLVSLLVISAFLFLGFTSIPTLITSRGVLISETPELQILSPGQFAVRKVQIRSGEEVARGDLLIELGPTKPGLTRSSLELQGTQIEKNLREASMAEEFYKNLLEGDRDFKNL